MFSCEFVPNFTRLAWEAEIDKLLLVQILARTAENHTPSWPANLRKYYFSNQVRAGDPMIRAAMVLLDANVPEAQVAFELDKLLQGRNNDTHCILLEDIDNKVAEALTDLQNNPVAKATLAESNATLLAIFEEYDALKTFFRLNWWANCVLVSTHTLSEKHAMYRCTNEMLHALNPDCQSWITGTQENCYCVYISEICTEFGANLKGFWELYLAWLYAREICHDEIEWTTW